MKSARIMGPNEPLEVIDSDNPKPHDNQVVVKVKAVGVCHSDLHLWEGGYDLGDGQFMKVTDRGVKYPVTPGHEIVGTVEEMGDNVNGYSKGDEVLVYPWIGCGQCPACKVENENLCDAPKSLGVFQDGGYSDYALVPHYKYLAKLDGVNPDSATSIACSGLTAYNAIKKSNMNSPEFLVIVGAGGLGLMGVQIAKAITSAKIICVDLDDAKLETAKEMGADFVVNSKDPETSQKIISICNDKGADSVVDFVNAPPTAKLGISVLRKRGNLVLVGLFGGSMELSLVTIPLKSITIQGAYTGNYNDMVELLDLTRKGTINPIITKRYTLDEANTALEDLKARKILGRAVINP
ncbi:MAG: alcohol dehydrogenase [Nitrosopumilus sp.]|uniref:Alcohol dehydrogenase catalytic domain-containing protein n=2 Tax=Candidatus Nitrosomaritimum aestuariumsis TaxID=3342354 RepID=A0AC60VZP7_9ARCH|nr:alcohol dehydrogenase catalytic domain-containing protein [Nitrosopumilaceae archaeon]MBA4461633.1 alcohol dehydrogenase catalytic domain-containing protein [Nitrosopumilaceae archaeon]MBA4464109.1 alcohol dehydrogenase catalytic domain-containing protein [Nitrosopumilaceae archaeon]NCF22571.1 alcohol dehydrogenase catalytic domain-containing protein [Nitrosopumilaceae archaeon]